MRESAGGEAAATGAQQSQPSRTDPPAYPLLVRIGGRWICRHELAELALLPASCAPDVQLRP